MHIHHKPLHRIKNTATWDDHLFFSWRNRQQFSIGKNVSFYPLRKMMTSPFLPHNNLPTTTTKQQQNNNNNNTKKLEAQVLTAAKGTATTLSSPTATWEGIKNIFILCTSNITDKKLKRLNKLLKKDLKLLIESRSVDMGHLLPDGFTPLHAACFVGNGRVVELFLSIMENKEGEDDEELREFLDARDLQGRTALHIAADKGHLDIVKLLKNAMTIHSSSSSSFDSPTLLKKKVVEPVGRDAPVDLTGRTPLAYAATSKEAHKHRSEIENVLFSPGDESVCGCMTPACDRAGSTSIGSSSRMKEIKNMESITTTRLEFGFAEMPGYRIEMEDALCCHYPLLSSSSSSSSIVAPIGLFGVFDGHGDGGLVSRYLADNLSTVLTSTPDFQSYKGGIDGLARMFLSSCPMLDERLKEEMEGFGRKDGGSTAVMALISEDAIVVGNVGDSRCILVQCCDDDDDNKKEKNVAMDEEEEKQIKEEEAKATTSNEEDDDNVETLAENIENLSMLEKKTEEEQINNKQREEKENKTNDAIVVTELSEDHKPNLPEERSRIERSGMLVMPEIFRDDSIISKNNKKKKKSGDETNKKHAEKEEEEEENDDDDDDDGYTTIWKIQKSETEKIAVSRAFGDFDYKSNTDLKDTEQAIVCTPDIRIHVRDEKKDAFLILACDGIWDVMSNEEVGDFVWSATRELLKCDGVEEEGEEEDGVVGGERIKTPALRGSAEDLPSSPSSSLVLPIVGDKLIVECLRRGSRDNMSVLIISLSSGVVTAGVSSRNGTGVDVKRVINFAEE